MVVYALLLWLRDYVNGPLYRSRRYQTVFVQGGFLCSFFRHGASDLPPLLAALGVTASVLSVSGCFGTKGGLTFQNSSPRIKTFMANGRAIGDRGSINASPSDVITFNCDAEDPERDPISLFWVPSAADARQSTTPVATASSAAATTTPVSTASASDSPTTTPTPAPATDATPTPGTDTSEIYTWQAPATNNVQYTITCTVRDDRGKSASRSVLVIVGTPPTPAAAPTPAPAAAPSAAPSPAAAGS